MKKTLLVCIAMAITLSAVAQRKVVVEDYHKDLVEDLPYSTMGGKINYGFIVDENGDNLKDGPLSIKCAITNYKVEAWPIVATYNGTFTVNTAYAKRWLNGPFTSAYRLNVVGENIFGRSQYDLTASMSGSFLNGVPNGAFKVSYNGQRKASLSANYKNGVLVGPFSCAIHDDNMILVKYSGTLTQSGKLTGSWNLNGTTATFQNGVLISKSYEGKSTKPRIAELSKQYAAGAITKAQLEEKNIVVSQDSILLGDYARIAILRDSGVDFEKLRGIDMSAPNSIKYDFLEEVCALTDAGVDILIKQLIAYSKDGGLNGETPICNTFNDGYKYGCIQFEKETNRYFIRSHRSMQEMYFTSGAIIGGSTDLYVENVYLTQKQFDHIDAQLLLWAKDNSCDLITYVAQHVYLYDSDKERLNKYINNQIDGLSVGDLEHIRDGVMREQYEKFVEKSYPHKTNENLLLVNKGLSDGGCRTFFISKESVAAYQKMMADIDTKIAAKKADEQARIAAQKEAEQAKKTELLRRVLAKPFEFMVLNKTRTSIAYNDEAPKFFYHPTYNSYSSEYRMDFESRLKDFCPCVGYEIVSVNDRSVVCNLKKRGKKDAVLVYQLTIGHNRGKLNITSFDITKAKQIQ